MSLDQHLLDKRVVERNIKAGRLDAAEYQRVIDGLPDLSGSIARSSVESALRAEADSARSAPVLGDIDASSQATAP